MPGKLPLATLQSFGHFWFNSFLCMMQFLFSKWPSMFFFCGLFSTLSSNHSGKEFHNSSAWCAEVLTLLFFNLFIIFNFFNSFSITSCIDSFLLAVVLGCPHRSGLYRAPVVFSRTQNSSCLTYFLSGNWYIWSWCWCSPNLFSSAVFCLLRWKQRCRVCEAGWWYFLYCSLILS